MIKKALQYLTVIALALSVSPFKSFSQPSPAGKNLPAKQFKLLPLPKQIELLKDKPSNPDNIQIVSRISDSANLPSPEGYILDIKNGYVTVTAASEAGAFYAVQTLNQLIQDAKDQRISIPACRITDYPDIAYRAIHLDLKHHLDSLSYYYKLMDRLAEVKVNAVIIEFEDKLRYKGAPAVGASHAIPIEDFAALSDYAKKRNIEISPLIQGLGHASFILKHPEYKELRDDTTSDWSFDPLNPKTYELQFSLYKDAMAATPHGKYLHIGGDEVGKLGMSELAKKSGMKPFELQMYWLKKVCEFASEHNRIPIFWDDMVFKLSNLYETTYDSSIAAAEVQKRWKENEKILNENINLFPKNCVYMRWNYDFPELPGNINAINWYKSHQLKVMAATSGQQIWPMLPRASSNFQSVKEFSKITAKDQLDGILLTLWDDTSPHFETYWRGIYDYALLTWNYKDISKDEAHAMFRHRFYGPQLSDKKFNFQDSLEAGAYFWETALINSGTRENYPDKIDVLDLPNENAPAAWSDRNKEKLANAKKEIRRYADVKQKIAKAMQLATRNKYALQIFDQLNELQAYPAQLLVKLEKYDHAASGAEKKAAAQEVKAFAADFEKIREKYESITGKTRVLHNPADYLPDQNHHRHLANGTINSDWMYVYELALNDSIKKAFTE